MKLLDVDPNGWIRILFCRLADVSLGERSDPIPGAFSLDQQNDPDAISPQISGESPTPPKTVTSGAGISFLGDQSPEVQGEELEVNNTDPKRQLYSF